MTRGRSAVGIVVGALVAGAGLRLTSVARNRGVPASELVHELPGLVMDEARFLAGAARGAMQDGVRAAREQEARLDKVLSTERPMREMS